MINGKPNLAKMELVSFKDGFHGRSMGALSATWQEKYQAPFAPLVPGFVMGTFNNCDAIKETINENTCGVIVEPIQVSRILFILYDHDIDVRS
jgi:acetylornithine aminotransferase